MHGKNENTLLTVKAQRFMCVCVCRFWFSHISVIHQLISLDPDAVVMHSGSIFHQASQHEYLL
jgi:hypothetical protein